MRRKKKTVLVFGAFDGLHDGHRFFLREAKKQGDYLIAAVAQDTVIKELKGRAPREPLQRRLAGLRASGLADEAIPADKKLGDWSALEKYRPEMVALGYDQERLKEKLEEFITNHRLPVTLTTLPPFKPDTLHSSLL